MMYHPSHRRTKLVSRVLLTAEYQSLGIHRNYPSYLGWHNYHFFLYVCIDDYEMFKGTHQKNFKKDFYTYIHINTLIQRYIRKELSARFCTLILNSMPLQGLAISDQESGNEAVRV